MTKGQRRGSAAITLTPGQIVLKVLLLAGFIAEGTFLGWHTALEGTVAMITLFYLVFTGFKHLCWVASWSHRFPEYELPDVDDPTLPSVSAMIALRNEEETVGKLIEKIKQMKYPKDRFEVLLLVDEDDYSLQAVIGDITLPDYIRVIIVPDAGPYLKPKVLLYGYPYTTGDIVVPFDAEDRMPPDQILHAVATLHARPRDRYGRKIGCVQARLTFWNPRGASGRSWVSSLVYGEYAVHYLSVLPGMDRLGLVFPYGGTSCYFLREALDDITETNGIWTFPHRLTGEPVTFHGPWDLNPTEDADIAWRLARAGWRGAVFNSVTNEEAPEKAMRARAQGQRWLHGYGLSGLVSLRQPIRSMRQVGIISWFVFNMFMLGTVLSLVVNPITWATTALYVTSRIENWGSVSAYVHSLFSGPVFYIALVAMLANFTLYIQKLFAVVQAQEALEANPRTAADPLSSHMLREQYGITLRIATSIPLWWAWRSVSAYGALLKLLRPSHNHSWSAKTKHGYAAGLEAQLEQTASSS